MTVCLQQNTYPVGGREYNATNSHDLGVMVETFGPCIRDYIGKYLFSYPNPKEGFCQYRQSFISFYSKRRFRHIQDSFVEMTEKGRKLTPQDF